MTKRIDITPDPERGAKREEFYRRNAEKYDVPDVRYQQPEELEATIANRQPRYNTDE